MERSLARSPDGAVDWLATALDALLDPVVTLEPVRAADGQIVDFVYRQANAAACAHNGLTREQMVGSRMLELFPGLEEEERGAFRVQQEALATSRMTTVNDLPYANELLGGEIRFYDYQVVPTGHAVVVTWRDVTERHDVAEQLRRRASVDPLTGVASRAEGFDVLARVLARPSRVGIPVVAAYVDVDGLKHVNDAHGHAVGDVLLRETARRIRAGVRADDVVARIGGDEFLLVLRGIGDDEDLVKLCDKLRRAATEPIAHQGWDLATTISIGATRARPEDSTDSIVDRADRAMYEVKATGGDGVLIV